MRTVLEVQGLSIVTAADRVPIVDDLRWSLAEGHTLGVVGESGSGKTTTALALLGVVRRGLVVAGGSVTVAGEQMLGREEAWLRKIRGRAITYLGQNPAASLTPTMRIGRQVAETLRLGPGERSSVSRWLESFGLPGDRAFQRRYPHQISGGQQQRVALARAFASRPKIVVLDEPTTGLDAVTQDLVLTEIERLRCELSLSVFIVSHDLAVVARLADRILVMRQGEIVEQGDLGDVLTNARHGYTRTLMAATLDHRTMYARRPSRAPLEIPALRLEHLSASYPAARGRAIAVEDVSLSVYPGRCVALVGGSGSGKTTIVRSVIGLHRPDGGHVYLNGVLQSPAVGDRSPADRRRLQLIHQDPSGSLNPRCRVSDAIARPLQLRRGISRRNAKTEIGALLDRVRLSRSFADRLPSQLSGGERQRVAIAKALAAGPEVLVCDEITSSLDTSVQATILDLVSELQTDLGLGVLFVSHDLGVVARVADYVIVLEHGRVCEEGPAAGVLTTPRHSITNQLLTSSPSLAIARGTREAREASRSSTGAIDQP